ncbi:TPA_exp: Structure-specific endonuclease subunit SLX4 [Trichophyton benhamiae CBS 112371]|nr:TPA_exp: Structure-specific endonuclease subunit SLX4 [Trichophyton benhamiae CBS 112371]
MHPADLQQTEAGSSGWESCGLRLEEATIRRDFWTPIKDTTPAHIDLTGSPVFMETGEAQDKGKDFRSLMSGFSFSRETSHEVVSDGQYPAEGPTTKQLLEFIPQSLPSGKHLGAEALDTTASSTSEGNSHFKPAGKPKRPAKSKITTITSLTTGRYESPFTSEAGNYISAGNDVESIQPARKPTSKRKATKAKSGTKISKDEYQAQFRPAPTMEALQTIENQTLLFGTSSQLERDSSPSVYGIESGLEHSQGQSESARVRSREPSSALGVSRFSKSKSLWAASSRDLDGYLLNVEMVDLLEPAAPAYQPQDEQQTTNKLSKVRAHTEIPPPIEHESSEKSEPSIHSVVNIDTSDTIQSLHEISSTHNNENGVASIPDFNRLSTDALTAKVASFGFKPIKSREKMIVLLEKCWENKRKAAGRPEIGPSERDEPQGTSQGRSLNITTNPIEAGPIPSVIPSIRTTPEEIADSSRTIETISHNLKFPPKTKGNTLHSKGTERDTQPNTIEINDSTDEGLPESSKQLTSSGNSHLPPRVSSRDRPNGLVPGPGEFSIRTKGVSTKENEPAELPNIFIQITNAVKAQPRIRSIKGIKQPTWHEKIVMYDPIWLDDFTLWLNVEGFKRIHEDREVHASLVREWCESKGICCSFKNKR